MATKRKVDPGFRIDLGPLMVNLIMCCDGVVKNIKTGNILKPYRMKKGHAQYSLSVEGKVKKVMGHRLIATYFVKNPKPSEYDCINHKDGNPFNNDYQNLEWCTDLMNKEHARVNGMFQQSMNRYNARFNEEQILTIHTLNWSQADIARHYKIASSVISKIKNCLAYKNFSVIYDK